MAPCPHSLARRRRRARHCSLSHRAARTPSPLPRAPSHPIRYDDDGPQLFQVDPSGAFFGWRASAIGKNYANAKTFLEKRYTQGMELEDAVHTALLTLREGFEGEMTSTNVQLAVVGPDRVFRILTPAEVGDYLAEAE